MKIPFSRILLATDLSQESQECWPEVSAIAKTFGGEIILARAIEAPEFSPPFDDAAKRALQCFSELREQASAEGLQVSDQYQIKSGAPVEVITACATELNVDLIVVGIHGGLGSVAEQVLGNADRPVWLIPMGHVHPEQRKILCAVDTSTPAQRALSLAVQLAKAGSVGLHLLTVLDAEAGDDAVSAAEEGLRAAASEHGLGDVEVEVRRGTVASEILSAVEAGSHDLVMMGSADRKGLDRLLEGNTSERILRVITASLLVVKG